MKLAKKLLAIVMVLSMVAAFSVLAFAADPSVSCSVGEYKDGKATVTICLNDCVGLTSGSLSLAYEAGKITKVLDIDGADKELAGKCGNAFSSEINKDANPMEYGFYFKNDLYDAAGWAEAASDYEVDGTVNANSFECLKLKLTAVEGTVVTVTGELKIGPKDSAVTYPVNTSFTIGNTPVPPGPHTEHTWDAGTVTKAATCKEEGVKTFTCTVCGETKTETIAKTAHAWDAGKVTKAATCTEEGVKTFTCTVCGETKTEAVAKVAHTWDAGKVTKEATETEDGEKTFTCSVCGTTRTEIIPKTGSKDVKYDKFGNKILAYDKNGQAIIGYNEKTGLPIYSQDRNAHKAIIPDVKPNDNGKDFVSDKDKSDKDKDPTTKAGDKDSNGTTAKAGKTTANVKTDAGKNTGDNSVLAIVAGVIALAGAAYVVTKKRK